MDAVVRPYSPEDADACAGIFDAAWHAGHPYAPRPIDRWVFERETSGERILVAEDAAQRVIGFVSVYDSGSFVHHLYVDPAVQGRGIGRTLLGHALALTGGTASLKCQARNLGAMAFYRRLGWTTGEAGEAETGPWVRMHSPEKPEKGLGEAENS